MKQEKRHEGPLATNSQADRETAAETRIPDCAFVRFGHEGCTRYHCLTAERSYTSFTFSDPTSVSTKETSTSGQNARPNYTPSHKSKERSHWSKARTAIKGALRRFNRVVVASFKQKASSIETKKSRLLSAPSLLKITEISSTPDIHSLAHLEHSPSLHEKLPMDTLTPQSSRYSDEGEGPVDLAKATLLRFRNTPMSSIAPSPVSSSNALLDSQLYLCDPSKESPLHASTSRPLSPIATFGGHYENAKEVSHSTSPLSKSSSSLLSHPYSPHPSTSRRVSEQIPIHAHPLYTLPNTLIHSRYPTITITTPEPDTSNGSPYSDHLEICSPSPVNRNFAYWPSESPSDLHSIYDGAFCDSPIDVDETNAPPFRFSRPSYDHLVSPSTNSLRSSVSFNRGQFSPLESSSRDRSPIGSMSLANIIARSRLQDPYRHHVRRRQELVHTLRGLQS